MTRGCLIMFSWKKYLVPFISVLVFSGCITSHRVMRFEECLSYIEVSQEKESKLVFRLVLLPDSFNVVSKYKFYSKTSPNGKGKTFYLTIFKEKGSITPVSDIQYMENWPGIKITTSAKSFDSSIDEIYYKDSKGQYPIYVGTKKTWIKYLKDKLNLQIEDISSL